MSDVAFEAIRKGDMPALDHRLAQLARSPSAAVHLSGMRDERGRSLATLAAELNRVEAITRLVAAGVYIFSPDDNGNTPLHVAAHFGQVEAIDAIAPCLRPEGIDARTSVGETAAHLAACRGHAPAMAALLRCNADPTVVNHAGDAPAHEAAHAGRLEVAKVLMAHDRALMEQKNPWGQTPALIAASAGHVAFVREMAGQVNLYMPDDDGNHAGHLAALYGRADMFDTGVLDDPMQMSAPNTARLTPVHFAAFEGKTEALEAMVRLGVPMPRGPQDWPAHPYGAYSPLWQQRVSQAVGAVAMGELVAAGHQNLAADLECRIMLQPFTAAGDFMPVRLPSVLREDRSVVQGSVISSGAVAHIFHPCVPEDYGSPPPPRDPLTKLELDPNSYQDFVTSEALRLGDPQRLALLGAVHSVYSAGGDVPGRAGRAVLAADALMAPRALAAGPVANGPGDAPHYTAVMAAHARGESPARGASPAPGAQGTAPGP